MMYNFFTTLCISTNHENYLEVNLKNVKKFHFLSGGSIKINNLILLKIIEFLKNCNDDILIVHNPLDPTIIDCIICDNIYIGTYEKKLPKNVKNLYKFFDTNYYQMTNCDIPIIYKKRSKEYINNATLCFKNGKEIHDLWENIYIKNIDFEKFSLICKKYINIIFKDVMYCKKSNQCYRYFGSISGYGSINYIPSIIIKRKKIYYIKGRPGTCKSSFMKYILDEATKRGIDAIIYPCASDPKSLDMVEFPELDVCIFDSTPPHEFFPTNDSDEIIDLYEYLLPARYDEANAKELNDIKKQYSETINLGITHLNKALLNQNEEENIYLSNVDFLKLSKLYNELINEIKS